MAKCRDCALLCWRPGCTDGGGDDFNTYVDLDDDSGCPSFRPAKHKPLMDALGKALKTLLDEDVLRELVQQAKNFPNEPILNLIDDIAPGVFAVLDRYQKEVADA